MKLVDKVLHFGEGRRVKMLEAIVAEVAALEPADAAAHRRAAAGEDRRVQARLDEGETLDELLPEAFAAVREAAWRSVGMRPFDVQVMGAAALHQGGIAEMKTGEGKTLVATLPVYLNALAGKGVHLVTVNDYLAARDAEWMGPIYRFLGLTVAALQNNMEPRRPARRLRRRRHLRYQHRVRLRLPARQHGPLPGGAGAARPPLLHRGRGRLHPRSTRRARRSSSRARASTRPRPTTTSPASRGS